MGRRPVSITVISILAIILAGFVILGTPCTAFLQFHPLAPNPQLEELNRDPVYVTNYIASLAVNFLLSLVLLAGAIGSLRMNKWGRNLMLIYSWLQIAYAVLSTVFVFAYVMPQMRKAFAGTAMEPALLGGMIAGAASGIVFGLGVPAIILFFFCRKPAVDAFNGQSPAAPEPFPVVFPGQPDR